MTRPDSAPVETPLKTVSAPSIAEQVLAVDPLSVATRIIAGGKRAALQASVAEIMAIALRLTELRALADLAAEMILTGDEWHRAPKGTDAFYALRSEYRTTVIAVANALETLGYGQGEPQPVTTQSQEKPDGEVEA